MGFLNFARCIGFIATLPLHIGEDLRNSREIDTALKAKGGKPDFDDYKPDEARPHYDNPTQAEYIQSQNENW